MKYNIFTVLNEGYEKFGLLFVSSIIDRLDLENIGNIFLYDTGLNSNTKQKLQNFEKVKIVNSGIVTGTEDELHGETWQKNVYSKAKLLKHCIQNQENFLPTVMVDVDSIFIQEFFDIIDTDATAVLCRRSSRGRGKNHQATSTHIGSFFSINNRDEPALKFLDNWISKIEKASDKDPKTGAYIPKESPALSRAYAELKEEIKLSDLPEPIIANIELSPPHEARIYHLKSDYPYLTVEARVQQQRAAYYARRYFI